MFPWMRLLLFFFHIARQVCYLPRPLRLQSISVTPQSLSSLHRYHQSIKSQQTVWEVFGKIAADTNGTNLGQGFPDWKPPNFLIESLNDVVNTNNHQYARPAGHIPLVNLLAKSYSGHLNRDISGVDEVLVTVGASQALYITLLTLLKPGTYLLRIKQLTLTYLG